TFTDNRLGQGAALAWTGKELIVWGGIINFPAPLPHATNVGARYDLATKTWTQMSSNGALSPRTNALSVWTGQKVFFWGGDANKDWLDKLTDGALYDPQTDAWRAVAPIPTGTEAASVKHKAFWTGSEVILVPTDFPPADFSAALLAYDPASDR